MGRVATLLPIMAAQTRRNGLPTVAVIRALAVRIGADPRSIERELLTPGSVTGIAGHRIRAVLRELGVGLGMPPIDPAALLTRVAGRGAGGAT